MIQRIGLLGGTFDPPHFGHLNLAIELQEHHQLDRVLVCPAASSPLKRNAPPKASPQDRLAMLTLLVEGLPDFSLCLHEIQKQGPSYTIDTIRALKKEYPHLYLLLSEETLLSFSSWKEPNELARLAPLLVGVRMHSSSPILNSFSATLTATRIMEISSHEIRDRIKKNLPCGHLMPQKILDYIHAHHLYL